MTPSDPSATRRGRIAAIGFSTVLLVALFFPASAIDENKAPPAAPQLSIEGITSGALLGQIRDAVSTNFGLRSLAIQTIARATLALGASPTPMVYLGEDGEPFLSEDFVGACSTNLEAFHIHETLDEIAAAQKAAGREFLFAVVPDKGSIDRDKLGSAEDSLLACNDVNRAYLESIPTIMTAWNSFEASDDELYFFGDSHWNYVGGSRFAVELLNRVQPGIVQPGDLVETQEQHSGDLFLLMGLEQLETTTVVTAERSGVDTQYDSEVTPLGYTVQRWRSSGDAALITGRTLIVHDSTFAYNSAVYGPYFEDLTSVPIQALSDPGEIARLGDYDRVIVQRVQRGVQSDLDLLLAIDWL